ncbi:MAG TPA: SurA N-terminal domain-containing protein [Terriglobales bacterium]|nr:SurA N-terminal domain-containing protein [Terriglobales bacterium]
MRRALQLVLVFVTAGLGSAYSGEVIDRIVAVVNRGVVLQSDVELAVRYEAFLEGRAVGEVSDKDYRKALDRLVDQELLRQEMGEALTIPASEVQARVAEIRSQFPEGRVESDWQARLGKYGLTSADLAERVRVQLELWRFVELRLRPNVRVDDSAVDSYYRDEFLPRLRESGAEDVPLTEVSARIRQILVERNVDQLLSAWLHNLRDQSEVHLELDKHSPGVVSSAERVANKAQ